jgi:glycine/D-amino acid oxidase-like deaminating enzyme
LAALVHQDSLHFAQPADTYWLASATQGARATPALSLDQRVDVAIVGAGFTGLSTALRLRELGASVCVLDAGQPAWGASGRNGGFCCFGSSKLGWQSLVKRYGQQQTVNFYQFQRQAIDWVRSLCRGHGLQDDITDEGEVCLAHSGRTESSLKKEQQLVARLFGRSLTYLDQNDLTSMGMVAAGSTAGLMSDVGFGLHPVNYARLLLRLSIGAGAVVYGDSEVTSWATTDHRHRLLAAGGTVTADHVVFATNGYTSSKLTPALQSALMPALSSVLVTRKLNEEELSRQGWRTTMPAYDIRQLLHYFRLLPDGRFLFGGRGGTNTANSSLPHVERTLRRDFERMFPHWTHVEHTHFWRGLVCLSSTYCPYVGPLDGARNAWTSVAYHGNGVAMASYCGRRLAELITQAKQSTDLPAVITKPPAAFPLPGMRPYYLKVAYAGYHIADRL